MKAVIELSGRQYLVGEGTKFLTERLPQEANSSFTIEKVLATTSEGDSQFGTPYLTGCTVTAKVIRHFKDAKVLVFKYKAKTNYRRKKGHRQLKTEILIESIKG